MKLGEESNNIYFPGKSHRPNLPKLEKFVQKNTIFPYFECMLCREFNGAVKSRRSYA